MSSFLLIALVSILVTISLIWFFLQKTGASRNQGEKSRPLGQTSQLNSSASSSVSTSSKPGFKTNPVIRDSCVQDIEASLLDASDQQILSPEAGPTKMDAIFIDMIRQAAELPSAVLELSNLLREEDVPVKKVADLVETDPVLSARILRVANSAAVGRGKVSSLHKAIVMLGFNQVWILVNQMLTARTMQPITKIDPPLMKALWRHGAATATCAKHLLLELGHWSTPKGPVVMTCALLHDVGKFLLRGMGPMSTVPHHLEEGYKPKPFVLEEQISYGINHCRVGYLLSTYWHLPEEICTTIAYHHHGSFSNWMDIPIHVRLNVGLVAISDAIANLLGYSEGMPVAWRQVEEFCKVANIPYDIPPLITRELKRDLKSIEKLIDAGG